MIKATSRLNIGGGGDSVALDQEVYRDLVETLFATKGAFGAGLAAGMLAPAAAWLLTREFVYFGLLMLMSGLAGYRLAIFAAYAKRPATRRREEARRWETLYAIGGIAFMTGSGISAAVLFYNLQTSIVAYYGVLVVAGFTGTLASRNAARPWIVFGQTIGACTPLAIVSLLRFDHWGIALLLVIGMVAIKSTTDFLHSALEDALRNGYDANRQKKKFSLALNSMTHGLCMGDANLLVSVVNRRVFDFFGIVAATTPIRLEALAHAIGRSANMPPAAIESFIERWRRHAAMKTANVFTHQIGERFFDFHCVQADAGGFVTVIENVTAQKRALSEIERIARFDDLTGLPNRFQFQDLLKEELARMHGAGNMEVALLNIDLDHFKDVNDTLGHSVGDQLLVGVSKRFAQCLPAHGVVARLGGDEFCVLLSVYGEGGPLAQEVSENILTQLRVPFSIDGNSITIGASIGLAFAPRNAPTPADLLKCSDLALYHAKDHGRGRAINFTNDMQESLTRKRELETELKRALEAGEFVLYYQPVVESRSGTVVALEALLRWRHPQRGMVPPLQFIPEAEETGLIVDIGAWALGQACLDALKLPADIRVSVNVAPRQFQKGNLPQLVEQMLEQSGLPPGRLELEITESTLLLEHERVDEQIAGIRSLGVRLAIDDFGTGYSSLSYLNEFAVHKIKIDRSFTCKALQSTRTQAIIGAVSRLAQDLEMDLVAEGVETDEQLAFLASKGIFLIQGYLFSPPRPLEEVALRFGLTESELSAA